MDEAYKAAAKLTRRLMEKEKPEDLKHLGSTQVVLVRGCYDKGESIFTHCGIPVTTIEPDQVATVPLDPDQILYVNCPGQLDERSIERVRSFVTGGGLLVTTDWALKHVLEKAFPGFVAYGGKATADDVVRVVFEPVEDTFLEGLLDPNDDPLWWLEGSSYPIKVLDPARVKVLASSKEMAQKYGEAPIVVAFEVGAGKVYHMTSHFYLQRAETRTLRHQAAGTDYAASKGVKMCELEAGAEDDFGKTSLTQVQSAYTSVRAVTNMAVEQAKRVSSRKLS
jgi:hypothetical protein